MTTFVPGPWKVINNVTKDGNGPGQHYGCFDIMVDNEQFKVIGDVKPYAGENFLSYEQAEATAALIGQAPDMYEAIQEFVDRVERGEIKSKYTYEKFKLILSKIIP